MQRRRREHRQVYRVIQDSDISVEVLDARFPNLTRSELVESFVKKRRKPLLLCLNKCDLVPLPINKAWRNRLNEMAPTIYVSSQQRLGTKRFRTALQRLSQGQHARICVFGVPNTGKSSLINILKGRHSASTSSRAGHTRHIQSLRISDKLVMFDTPGVSPVNTLPFDLQVFLGAIPVEKIEDPLDSLDFILTRIRRHYSKGFLKRYEFSSQDLDTEIEELVSIVAKRRGRMRSEGKLDLEETARTIIREFLEGKFEYFERPSRK
ncbi:MAG: GTPase [Candidatus Hodarchaeales archaeon]|jgi:ribosome biogenesis GTPase A